MRGRAGVLADIWPSIVATVLAAVGGFVSLGTLGLVLYGAASPVLLRLFPPLDAWDQTLVWPLLIAVPIVWSPVFVVAGLLNRRWRLAGWRRAMRIAAYVVLVWSAAVASWSALLSLNRDVWI